MVFFLFNVLFGGAGGGGGQPSKEFDPDPFLGELRWDARAPAMAATAPDIFWVDQERLRGMSKNETSDEAERFQDSPDGFHRGKKAARVLKHWKSKKHAGPALHYPLRWSSENP